MNAAAWVLVVMAGVLVADLVFTFAEIRSLRRQVWSLDEIVADLAPNNLDEFRRYFDTKLAEHRRNCVSQTNADRERIYQLEGAVEALQDVDASDGLGGGT